MGTKFATNVPAFANTLVVAPLSSPDDPATAVGPLLHLTFKTAFACSDDEAPPHPGGPDLSHEVGEDWVKFTLIQRNDERLRARRPGAARAHQGGARSHPRGCTPPFYCSTLIQVTTDIAGLGLLSNSVATSVASIHVSPPMRPWSGWPTAPPPAIVPCSRPPSSSSALLNIHRCHDRWAWRAKS